MSKRSQIESIDSPESPPHKKAKLNDIIENEDQIVTVIIGNEQQTYSSTLLANLPYFAAKLSNRWRANNTNNTNDRIVVSTDHPFIFSMNDLNTVLTCFDDKNKPIIPADLNPRTTFLSFMQCITFLCVQLDNKSLMDYYTRCTVLIDNDILRFWKTSNIPQVVQFASKVFTNRNNEIIVKLAGNIESKIKSSLTWYKTDRRRKQASLCNEEVITQFEYIINLFLKNFDENSNIEPMIKALKACAKTIMSQMFYISSVFHQSNQCNKVLFMFLKVLLDFTKVDKFFGMIYPEIISLMVRFCAYVSIKKRLDAKVTELWGGIVVYLFKTPQYKQIYKRIIDQTLCVFITDEKCMKQIFEAVDNTNGELLAIGIMEWNINNARTQAQVGEKYDDFCSKYFNPVNPSKD